MYRVCAWWDGGSLYGPIAVVMWERHWRPLCGGHVGWWVPGDGGCGQTGHLGAGVSPAGSGVQGSQVGGLCALAPPTVGTMGEHRSVLDELVNAMGLSGRQMHAGRRWQVALFTVEPVSICQTLPLGTVSEDNQLYGVLVHATRRPRQWG